MTSNNLNVKNQHLLLQQRQHHPWMSSHHRRHNRQPDTVKDGQWSVSYVGTRGSEQQIHRKILDELERGRLHKSATVRAWRYAYGCHNHDLQTSPASRARESKAVRRSLIDKLEELQQANSLPHRSPNITRSPTPRCQLAKQKLQLEQQLWPQP